MREAEIHFFGEKVVRLWEDELGFGFQYEKEYLRIESPLAIAHTLPLQSEPFTSQQLHPFFDGLIPEGWLLELASTSWKLNPRDIMGLLLSCCRECIGAVQVITSGDER